MRFLEWFEALIQRPIFWGGFGFGFPFGAVVMWALVLWHG
jgi:hypothetical protein